MKDTEFDLMDAPGLSKLGDPKKKAKSKDKKSKKLDPKKSKENPEDDEDSFDGDPQAIMQRMLDHNNKEITYFG